MKKWINKQLRKLGYEIRRSLPEQVFSPIGDQWIRSLEEQQPIELILDVGAHHGQTISRFRSRFTDAEIFAFEPHKPSYNIIGKLKEGDQHLHTFNVALGDKDGEIAFNLNRFDATNSVLSTSPSMNKYFELDIGETEEIATVEMIKFDTFYEENLKNRRIDIIKIDAQGYERQILEGMGSLLSPNIIRSLYLEVLFVELYESQTWCGDVMKLLYDRGYRLYGFEDVVSDSKSGWKWADALFIGR